MNLIVYKLIMEDTDTQQLYETGYKFDHSRIAEEVDSEVSIHLIWLQTIPTNTSIHRCT